MKPIRSKPKPLRLGDLQLRIMKVLWERQEATVAQVLEALAQDRNLAYTTVATMLRKMEERGLVAHRAEGRMFIYQAEVPAEAITQSLTDHWVERLFEGSLTQAVSHLLSTREVSRAELAKLERMIEERKKAL